MSIQNLNISVFDKLKDKKILVVGDVILDHFVWGYVSRISPEAPVPIVTVERENDMPGGAANVANNLVALGSTPIISSIIGEDNEGKRLRKLLESKNVDCSFLVTNKNIKTIVKSRIIAQAQHVVRVDWDFIIEKKIVLSSDFLEKFETAISSCDAIIVQDHNKGIIRQQIFDILKTATAPIIIDPNRYNTIKYAGSIITPNFEEAKILSGASFDGSISENSLKEISEKIFEKHDLKKIVITLSEKGIALCEKNGNIKIQPVAKSSDVFDVSGAGDTVVSVLACALATDVDLWTACTLANIAGGIVVGKMGTATTTFDEIKKELYKS